MKEAKKLDSAEEVLELTISYEERGKEIGRKEVAVNMLKKGLDVQLIMETAKLTLEEIEELRNRL